MPSRQLSPPSALRIPWTPGENHQLEMRKLVFKNEFAVMGDGAALSLVQQQENVTTNIPGHEGCDVLLLQVFQQRGMVIYEGCWKGTSAFPTLVGFQDSHEFEK